MGIPFGTAAAAGAGARAVPQWAASLRGVVRGHVRHRRSGACVGVVGVGCEPQGPALPGTSGSRLALRGLGWRVGGVGPAGLHPGSSLMNRCNQSRRRISGGARAGLRCRRPNNVMPSPWCATNETTAGDAAVGRGVWLTGRRRWTAGRPDRARPSRGTRRSTARAAWCPGRCER